VPLSAYAADGKPATCSKEHAVRWIWGIVRWGSGDFMRTRYRRRLFSTSLQEIWLTGVIYWPMNENAPINHRPYANLLCKHKACLILLCLLSARELQISWPLRSSKASVAEPLGTAEAVRGGRFVAHCRPRGTANCFLNQARIQMVAALFPSSFSCRRRAACSCSCSRPFSPGKHGAPILTAFAIAHGQLTPARSPQL
jgi:hypothetical protein